VRAILGGLSLIGLLVAMFIVMKLRHDEVASLQRTPVGAAALGTSPMTVDQATAAAEAQAKAALNGAAAESERRADAAAGIAPENRAPAGQ
jgi:hypothetical protein